MYYIKDEDYNFISNKFHDTKGPFNPMNQFIRHDAIFDASTGMHGDDLIKGISENDKKYEKLPHSVRKARAMEYALDNTRILCDSRDIFPAINAIDRPIARGLINKWRADVIHEFLPDVYEENDFLSSRGAARPFLDYSHSVPVWDRLFALGFSGVLEEAMEAKKKHEAGKTLTEEETAFFDSIEIAYTAIMRFLGRLAALAEQTSGCEDMGIALRNLQKGAPTTFYEAMMFEYIYFLISEHIDSVSVRSCGNFDKLFYPYYKKDMENGVSEETLKTQLAYFFMQFTAIGNYWCQPVYLGGTDKDGNTNINHLSYVFLDVYDKMGIYNPKVQIKYSKRIPKDFTLKALDMIRRGHNSIVFASEEHMKKALRYNGEVSEEEIRCADLKGCYEFLVQGGMDTEGQLLNLLKPLEYVLHGGKDGITGELMGLEEPVEFETFEDLLAAYKRQLKYLIDKVMGLVNRMEGYMSYINPLPLLSATFPTCLEKIKDANSDGGRTNNTYMGLGGIASIADSLAAIKKFVYDEKVITLSEMIDALDKNFEGYEALQKMLVNDKDKYGNNMEFPDSMLDEVVSFAVSHIQGKPNSPVRGGFWSCGMYVSRGIYDLGKVTMASPNGRFKGEELSKNLSPTMGANHKGLTAAVLSNTRLDMPYSQMSALDAAVSPSAAKGDDGLEAVYSVLNTFVDLGGQVMNFNMTDAETLRKAQKNPEQYRDIQIRVAGWNVLFSNINEAEQEAFIRQAEMACI